jgi:hypothetical protein
VSTKEETPSVDDTAPVVLERSPEQARKNQAAIGLLDAWERDESGYDERVWPTVKKLLEENHPGPRKLFRD